MADDRFDRDLRHVVHDYPAVDPPAALEEWMEHLPANALARPRSPSRLLRPLVSAAVVLAVAALALGVYWVRSESAGPAALPSGEPLAIVTEPNPPQSDACQQALMSGLMMTRSGSEVIFEGVGITWPYGTKALLVDGKAQLFAPEGWLIGIEGQTLPDLWGGLGVDDRFHVCHIDRPDG